jgi:transketolase C-terminal domain/subunit
MSVLLGHMPAERLLHYRESESKLPGHPERGLTPGLEFSSGRLGHMWPYANGVAMAHPDKAVLLFGSDGSQMEGNDAEAARLCVAHGLAVKLVIDDNDVTISGHPSRYMPGFDVARTLAGHGLPVDVGEGEDLTALHTRMCRALQTKGPVALVNKRKMAPGVTGIEGSPKAHDVVKVPVAAAYLAARGLEDAVSYLKSLEAPKRPTSYRGVAAQAEWGKNRETFGMAVVELIGEMTGDQRARAVRVFDNDLEGSCGLAHVKKAFPQLYVQGGVMERGNYSAAAGFGMERGRQGVFATFSAFQEMLISEITMARLNDANVLAHFSHAGVAEILDNTCHFGINNFFADSGLGPNDTTRLYFPADQHQMRALVQRVFHDPGLRFVFSPRSALPDILDAAGKPMYAEDYRFEPGKDHVVLEGSAGWVVSYGDMLHLALDAVLQLRVAGLDVGLLNKSTLNQVDEASLARVGKSGFVLVVESQNINTGLGARFGTWLIERGLRPRYARLGTHERGHGGGLEQIVQQGLDSPSIVAAVRALGG